MRKLKIAINGFGRIGRAIIRAGYKEPKIEFVAVNDLGKSENLAYLLKFDSVYGRFPEKISLKKNRLIVGKQKIKIFNEPNFLDLRLNGVDVVIEATGKFDHKSLLKAKTKAKIFATYPVEKIPLIIFGVNHKEFNNEKVISLGSCTGNVCIPLIHLLKKELELKKIFILTLNSYVSQQRLVDSVHKDLRASRAAPLNLIPRETSAIKQLRSFYPELREKVDGIAVKLPTPCGSLMQFIIEFDSKISKQKIDKTIKNSKIPFLDFSTEPIVLTDIIGFPELVYDSNLTKVIGETAQIFVWYDNEFEYAKRVIDMIKFIKK